MPVKTAYYHMASQEVTVSSDGASIINYQGRTVFQVMTVTIECTNNYEQ